MPKSSRKPKWPHGRKVTMTAHKNGQWCKKILGKVHYFGPWADADGALERYLANADDLHRGLPVQTTPTGAVTVADLLNEFLTCRKADVVMSHRTDSPTRDRAITAEAFRKYMLAAEVVIEVVGRNRPADSLRPRDFTVIKEALNKRYNTITLSTHLTRIRSMFTWGYNMEILENAPRFGDDFRAHGLARATRRTRHERGKKLLDAETIRALLDKASPQLSAAIYLGLNAGFYAIDCSDLRRGDIDFDRRVITLARGKTEVHRVAPIWLETAAALQAAVDVLPEPKDPEYGDRALLTQRGDLWVSTSRPRFDAAGRMLPLSHNDHLSREFRQLFIKADIERPAGCGFSWLRHVFFTIGRRTGHYDPVNVIMGHAAGGMVDHYLEDVGLTELRAVTEFVRGWLLTPAGGDKAAVVGRIG